MVFDFLRRAVGQSVNRLRAGLSRTRRTLVGPLRLLLHGRRLDAELLAELRQRLIVADLGVATTNRVMADLETAWKEKRIESGDEALNFLKDELKKHWPEESRSLRWATSGPTVILVTGVNGQPHANLEFIHAEGLPAAEMKHGPLALINPGMPAVFIATRGSQYNKLLGNIQEVKARGGKIIAVASEGDQQIDQLADHVFHVPDTIEPLQPLLTVLPLQLLAYHAAVARGCNVDKPRNLAKSVTVE